MALVEVVHHNLICPLRTLQHHYDYEDSTMETKICVSINAAPYLNRFWRAGLYLARDGKRCKRPKNKRRSCNTPVPGTSQYRPVLQHTSSDIQLDRKTRKLVWPITAEGVALDPGRIEGVLSMQRRENVGDLQQFICAVNGVPEYCVAMAHIQPSLGVLMARHGAKKVKLAKLVLDEPL